MTKVWLAFFTVSAVVVISNVSLAQDIYVFGFQGGPDAIDEGDPGDTSSHRIQNTLTHSGPGAGAQGWSFSVVADNASITGISTGVCSFPPSSQEQMDCENDPNRPQTKTRELFFGGFEQSELTTGGTGECEGRAGAVSGLTISFAFPVVYPPNETHVLAEVTVEIVLPDTNDAAVVRYVDSCQGGGQPIETIAVQDGLGLTPTEKQDKVIALNVGPLDGKEPFNRGEVTGDGRHNITDAIVIVNRVFNIPTAFTPADCEDMFDANGDASLGVGDPIYLLSWIFKRGAPPPPPPFQVCEPIAEAGLGCVESNCVDA